MHFLEKFPSGIGTRWRTIENDIKFGELDFGRRMRLRAPRRIIRRGNKLGNLWLEILREPRGSALSDGRHVTGHHVHSIGVLAGRRQELQQFRTITPHSIMQEVDEEHLKSVDALLDKLVADPRVGRHERAKRPFRG